MSLWKASLNRSIRELRFVLKQGKEHSGTWRFVQASLPDIRMLNQSTFVSLTELPDSMATPSACHIHYGDSAGTEEMILTSGLSSTQFEDILKSKVAHGLTLARDVPRHNGDRGLPLDTVQAHKYVRHIDDAY